MLVGATMPFSQHNIDPQHIEALRAAFRRVCDILQLNCEADDPMTEIVVMKIVELAKAGELDPERLCLAVMLTWMVRHRHPRARRRRCGDRA
jgi:hypothetical protein